MKNDSKKLYLFLRILFSILLLAGTVVYISFVLNGSIPSENRIDGTILLLIVSVIIVSILIIFPDSFRRLRLLEIGGVKLEMIEEIKNNQAQQAAQLQDIILAISLSLPKTERKHLENLLNGKTANYIGNHNVRTELRHLRGLGLIEMVDADNNPVAKIENKSKFDLKEFVQLTKLGKKSIERIISLENTDSLEEMVLQTNESTNT